MTDIVQRLRLTCSHDSYTVECCVECEAAEAIEYLRRNIADIEKDRNQWEMLCGELSPKLTATMEQLAACEKERDAARALLDKHVGGVCEDLAASQHYAQHLRKALCTAGNCIYDPDAYDEVRSILALPHDTSALDTLIAERDKYRALLKMVKEALELADFDPRDDEGRVVLEAIKKEGL